MNREQWLTKVATENLLKAECSECGYLVRVTQKWVDVATPICPVCLDPMELG